MNEHQIAELANSMAIESAASARLQDTVEALNQQVKDLAEELEALKNPPIEPPEGLLPDEERRNIFLQSVPDWVADETYVEGALVKHNGKVWRALPDVGTHPPDEVYDLNADPQTGGWAPIEY